MVTARTSRSVWGLPMPLFWAGIAVVSAACIFALPLAFPPQAPSFSSSYTVGFNNRVAAVAAALMSLAVAGLLWRRESSEVVPAPGGKLPMWWLGAAALVAVVYTGLLGWRVVHADMYFSDAGYFITQLTGHPHGLPYRDFEFPYGPLLFYWPALFMASMGKAGVRPEAAYMVSLGAMQVAGLGLAFYLLQKLPLSRTLRGAALATMTFGTMTPLLGLNYTLFRFLLPYAAMFWIAERRTAVQQALWFGVGEMLMLAVSVEIGIAFAGGVVLYALYQAVMKKAAWGWLALAPVASFALFAVCVGPGYFRMMARFAAGMFNMPVEPLPHLCVYLIAAVAVGPMAVVAYARRGEAVGAPMVAMYGASLGMIPSALGHCDGLHVFFSGLGSCLLSLVAVNGSRSAWGRLWMCLLLVPAVYSQVSQVITLRAPLGQAMSARALRTEGIDAAQLEAMMHGERIAAPISLPPPVLRELMRDGQYQPSFFCYMMSVWDRQSEELKIAEMRRARYALLPAQNLGQTYLPNNRFVHRAVRLGYRYKIVHPPYVFGGELAAEIEAHWVQVATLGQYRLYRQQ